MAYKMYRVVMYRVFTLKRTIMLPGIGNPHVKLLIGVGLSKEITVPVSYTHLDV